MGCFTQPWAYNGPALMGFVRDLNELAYAQAKPAVPGVALTNPVRDCTGLTNSVVTGIPVVLCLRYNMLSSVVVCETIYLNPTFAA